MHFKLIHNRGMTNKIIFRMNLADSSTSLSCNREETVVHAFLECENVTMLQDSGGALNVG